jgi:Na+-translocating ferredoxin:NAD+ oxidoreductase RnfD subunit
MSAYDRTASQPRSANQSANGTYGQPAKSRAQARQAAPGPLLKFIRTPKGTVLVILVLLMLVAAIHVSDRPGIGNTIAAVATAAVIDWFVAAARKNKKVFPDGGIITGLIIGLVLSGSVSWHVAALTSAIAVISKHLLKIGRKPIFNPAAFALLFTLLAFHTGQSWWGDLADLPIFFLPLLFIGGYFMTARVNKFPQVLTFLFTYFLLLTVAAAFHLGHAAYTPGDAIRVPIVNSALFMAFFMLTDPPTSPGKYEQQVTFSIIVAVVSVAFYLVFGGLSYLLIGLLVANGWRAFSVWRSDGARKHRIAEIKAESSP